MERTDRARHRAGPVVRGLFVEGRSGNFSFGLILIAIGVVLTLQQQGFITRGFWREGWPWIIVFLAVVQLVTARSASRIGDAVSFGLLGGWLLVVQSHWHGLTWRNSWPLALAAMGAGIVAHAIAGLFMRESRARVLADEKEGPGNG
jgi:cell wall-active antibiotic response 4TMS protein YvqF